VLSICRAVDLSLALHFQPFSQWQVLLMPSLGQFPNANGDFPFFVDGKGTHFGPSSIGFNLDALSSGGFWMADTIWPGRFLTGGVLALPADLEDRGSSGLGILVLTRAGAACSTDMGSGSMIRCG